jgi:hypothetical protein
VDIVFLADRRAAPVAVAGGREEYAECVQEIKPECVATARIAV